MLILNLPTFHKLLFVLETVECRLLHRIIQILSHFSLGFVQLTNLLSRDAEVCIYLRAHRTHHIVSCLHERVLGWDDHVALFEH